MAALDPTETPETDEDGNTPEFPRATLRLIKRAFPDLGDDEDEELDDEYLKAMLAGSDEEDSEDEEEANGGPSDPTKAKKQKQAAAIKKLLEATQDDDDEDMEDAKPNGIKGKGKGKITDEDDEEEDDEDDDDSDLVSDDGADLENFVVCTLDTEKVSYQCNDTARATIRILTNNCRTISNPLTLRSTTVTASSLLSAVLTPFI